MVMEKKDLIPLRTSAMRVKAPLLFTSFLLCSVFEIFASQTVIDFSALNSPSHASIAKGKTVFSTMCVTCHGKDLKGGIGPSLIDAYWKTGDSKEVILDTITNGIDGTEMIAFGAIYSEDDRKAIVDYILSEQEGLRSLKKDQYSRKHFKGKRFSLDLAKGIKADVTKPIPENKIYFKSWEDSISHFNAKLIIKDDGVYEFQTGKNGRTSVFLNGQEVYYVDATLGKNNEKKKFLNLKAGSYSFDVFHEEPKRHKPLYKLTLSKMAKAGEIFKIERTIAFNGLSLHGGEPKLIAAGSRAKIIRKLIPELTLKHVFYLLPNKVLVAFDPAEAKVVKAWQSAKIDQSPSITERSYHASVVEGKPLASTLQGFLLKDKPTKFTYLSSTIVNDKVLIKLSIDGSPYSLEMSPEGENGYKIKGFSDRGIQGLSVKPSEASLLKQDNIKNGQFEISIK